MEQKKFEKKFPLRFEKPEVFTQMESEAEKRKWSVNTLINFLMEEFLKSVAEPVVEKK